MRLVIIESPFRGNPQHPDYDRNVEYARRCLLDSLKRGEAPLASHLLYPQVLDDTMPVERHQGIEAGLAWAQRADITVVYEDLGISPGMHGAIERAYVEDRRVEYRKIGTRAA